VFEEAKCWHKMRGDATDLYHWCSEFPDIRAATHWLFDREIEREIKRTGGWSNHPRKSHAPKDINAFREHLRGRLSA
jgi:hypothetical protein